MTHTDPTAADLLAGVLARPECDTARLVYADRLEEIAGSAPCPECGGTGQDGGDVYDRGMVGRCPTCRGTGTVSDGLAERAELIRVQVELARLGRIRLSEMPVDSWHALAAPLRAREREWFGIPCPECEGRKKMPAPWAPGHGGQAPVRCRHCTGTGFAPVGVRRGFVESVRCWLGDVLREQYAGHASGLRIVPGDVLHPREWVLTSWARGVLAAHPVTRWEIVDREPDVTNPFDTAPAPAAVRSWYREDGIGTTRHEITRVVYDELPGDGRHYVGDGEKCFRDEAEARDALARAVGRVARRLAGLPEVTP